MDEVKKTWEEKQAEKAEKSKVMKQMIIAECNRIVELLENDAETTMYGYGEYKASELFNKMKELRRDTITLERIQKGW
jgi:sortase (surface protein transpeptidase)